LIHPLKPAPPVNSKFGKLIAVKLEQLVKILPAAYFKEVKVTSLKLGQLLKQKEPRDNAEGADTRSNNGFD
jgi:hypothetical protein